MDIFCTNLPEQIQENHLRKEFAPILKSFGIITFSCRRLPKRNAILTILEADKAEKVLAKHGQDQARKKKPANLLFMFGKPVYLTKSNSEPNEFFLRALANEQQAKLSRQLENVSISGTGPKRVNSFFITTMFCGMWDYQRDAPVFTECYRRGNGGKIVFGKSSVQIMVTELSSPIVYHLEFAYSNIWSIYLGGGQNPSVILTSEFAPRLYIENMAQVQEASRFVKGPRVRQKTRVGHFGGGHEHVAATCFTYRFLLQDRRDVYPVRELSREKHVPPIHLWTDRRQELGESYLNYLDRFEQKLWPLPMPYRIKFQLQRLVTNGLLYPGRTWRLFPCVQQLLQKYDVDVVVDALRRFSQDLQYPAPDVAAADIETPVLQAHLFDMAERVASEQAMIGKTLQANPNNIFIHRVKITPCAMRLSGPHMETNNRVLRKYADRIDNFLRVEFVDELGDPVRYDPQASLDLIFNGRFKTVLNEGILIGGRQFEFLGFSHSSLRAQTCWFVAPFIDSDKRTCNASSIIEGLGYFGDIKSPAKLAARIGQTFSDTLTSISIPEESVLMNQPDVERNGRVFSDGVGTFSRQVMYKIWREYALRAKVKPTVFQIRFAGAKGMISWDSTKTRERLMLRKSMVKFPAASDSWNIEICGSGVRSLPFFLNNQLIKILEDLGVKPNVFVKLQRDEIDRLKATMRSTEAAAQFLEESSIPESVRLPWLIRMLEGFGIDYYSDPFLRRVMELVLLLKLRDLKYRGRIRVRNAVTLYGIMDETGVLREGEIFCPAVNDDGLREILVQNNVMITRSPALHPGDIQIVNAVDVPADSPLRKLHNCVVFSQWGDRDLPSMLSGGDLDGDLYNIIYDKTLLPERIAEPADYPRAKEMLLDRPVQRSDIIDFFVLFMQQDQLGRIATIHQTLADQKKDGTFDQQCLLLAELHSVAVDFSKTGNPVNVALIPKYPRNRPDFLAPSPRIRIAESLSYLQEYDAMTVVDDEDGDDGDGSRIRYYQSNRVLGTLYRNIDEGSFLRELERSIHSSRNEDGLRKLWSYVERETMGFAWDHLVPEVRENIKVIYEDGLWDMMNNYSSTPWKSSVTEYEVFIGAILGHSGKQNKRQKEIAKSMIEEYNRLVEYVISRIEDREAGGVESLERSIACFWVALHDPNDGRDRSESRRRHQHPNRQVKRPKLLSFQWIAAIKCLTEVDKLHRMAPFKF